MRKALLCAAVSALLLAACSSKQETKSAMTERQRDSTIAASKLPGAGVVGKALEQSDSAKARADQSETETP
jgi:uncharacterized protein YcfL